MSDTDSNEIKIAVLQNQMNNVEIKVDELDKKLDEGLKDIKKVIEAALLSKANVWVEQALKWFIVIVVGAVIIAVLGLIGLKAQLI